MLVMVNTANESVQVKVPMEHAGKTMTDPFAQPNDTVRHSHAEHHSVSAISLFSHRSAGLSYITATLSAKP